MSRRQPRAWARGYDPALREDCSGEHPTGPTCALKAHRGWHVSAQGYAWHPEDPGQTAQLPPPTTRKA